MGQKFLLMVLVALVSFGTAFAEAPEQIGLYESNGLDEWIPTSAPLSVEPVAGYTATPDYTGYTDSQAVAYSEPAAQPDTSLWLAASHEEAAAEMAEAPAEPAKPLEISVSADWVSKYMFRGFDVLDDSGAYQPSVDIGLGCGLHFNWWASYSSHDRGKDLIYEEVEIDDDKGEGTVLVPVLDRHDLDEHDYTVYWGGDIADCIDVELGFIYYDFIHLDSRADFMEYYGTFTLSDMPLSPYFGAYYGHEKHDDTLGEGWNTVIGGSHSLPLCGLTCGGTELTLDLAADVWYNGGQYNVDTGWSHATFGGGVTFPLCENLEFTPGLYYQLSMEDEINDEDEWWATLSLAYTW